MVTQFHNLFENLNISVIQLNVFELQYFLFFVFFEAITNLG